MLKYLFCAGLLALAAQAASTSPQTPQAGIVRGADGILRPLWGVSANLINGTPFSAQKIIAVSFSNEAGLVLTPGSLELLSVGGQLLGVYPTTELRPVLSVSKGANTALAFLPSEKRLLRWAGHEFTPIPLDAERLSGPIVDAQVKDAHTVELLIQEQPNSLQRVRVAIATGEVISSESYLDAQSPALVIGPALVSTTTSGIQTDISGVKTQIPLANTSAITMERAASHSVHVSSPVTHRDWILHLEQAQPSLSEIPTIKVAEPGEVKP